MHAFKLLMWLATVLGVFNQVQAQNGPGQVLAELPPCAVWLVLTTIVVKLF